MHPANASWDNLMFGIPLLLMFVFGYFRLDETFAPRRNRRSPRPPARPVADPSDISILTDPDGRPWI